MSRATTAVLVGILLLPAARARAADEEPTATLPAFLIVQGDFEWPRAASRASASRGSILPALYASFVALEVYDGYATSTGLQRGAREANVLTGGLYGNTAAIWAVKGAATATSVYMAERLWRQHRRGEALAIMVVSNALMAAVAAHNLSVLHAPR